MNLSAGFMSPTTRTPVSPWPHFCGTTCNSAAPPRYLVVARHLASETLWNENGTKRHNCGMKRRAQGIKRNKSGTLRLRSDPSTATFSPTGTLQGCKASKKDVKSLAPDEKDIEMITEMLNNLDGRLRLCQVSG